MDLYPRYGPALRRKCERLLGCSAEAEDVVQGLFLDLLQLPPERLQGLQLPYLYRAATHRCLNRLRSRRRRQALLHQHGDILAAPGSPSAEGQVISRDLLAEIDRRLDRRSAEIVVYHYVDGMSQGEIADMLAVSRRAIVKRLALARRLLAPLQVDP